MHFYLSGQTTISRLKIGRQFWVQALSLASFYGWQPRGTLPPTPSLCILLGLESEGWNGTYLTKEGQTVTAEDALSLAMALETSLDDIPDFNIDLDRSAKLPKGDSLSEKLSPEEIILIEETPKSYPLDLSGIIPFEYFAGDEKGRLADLIRFCRLGSFIILRI